MSMHDILQNPQQIADVAIEKIVCCERVSEVPGSCFTW